MFKEVGRTLLYENVARQICDAVRKGELQPGAKLPPERELMQAFGVSRHSLREALKTLASQGILEIRPNSGTYVAGGAQRALAVNSLSAILRESEHPGLLEVRKVLEVEIARFAARRATPEHLAALRKSVDDFSAAVRRGEDGFEPDLCFHRTLAMATRNPAFLKVIDAFPNLIVQVEGLAEQSVRHHRLIYEAVRDRDEELAARRMKEHLETLEPYVGPIEAES